MSLHGAWMLFVGLLLVVGTLGCGDKQLPELGRDEAIAEIKKLGGTVGYHEESPERPEILFFRQPSVTDAHLVYVKGLTSLEHLSLKNNQITGAGLKYLEGLTNLKSLDLSDTQVTDAGLEHLRALTGLLQLDLSGTQVTDAGLEHLKGLTSLLKLTLNGTQVTDAGVKELKLPNLKYLGH